MKLYGVSLSPYYERCVIALDIKDQLDNVECTFPPGGIKSPEHLAMNPIGKIPFFDSGDGFALAEGQIILEYLEDVLDGQPLLSHLTPEDKAIAALVCRLVDTYLFPAFISISRAQVFGNVDEKAIEETVNVTGPKALDDLEHFMPVSSARAVAGDWSIADCTLIPFMYHYFRFAAEYGLTDLGDRPKLTAWWDNVKDTEIVQNCFNRMDASVKVLRARQ